MMKVLVVCVAIAAAAVLAVPAALADNGAGKATLLNHAFGSCSGTLNGSPQDGFAVVKPNGDGTVSIEVSVKNGPADAVYFASLVQTPNGAGCNQTNPDVELTTNGQGNGNLHLTATMLPSTTDAFVELIPANAAAVASGLIVSQDIVFG